ncbi:presenilins-associated rhomboid-like protein, mitochondrial isoform X2 [Xenia sp. Carnegie-2017]|uniref:presenilins-associated rhomboid-like protein, mitochondrial isoform X2 n=1 Tax=Xenia sp. Carnegie-2017 TaxID=2897299 RepID=UPI001F0422A2|nr:presenilins-associated rhomboid-like protein, mitochondrial isoform X2 [Xenia sp. Carnegie-2017]
MAVVLERLLSQNCLSVLRNNIKFRKKILAGQNYHRKLRVSRSRLVLKPLAFSLIVSSGSFAVAAIFQYESFRSSLPQQFRHRLESSFQMKLFKFRQKLNKWWNALHAGEKTATALIALNTGVFLLWRVRSLKQIMTKWFTSTPISGLSFPMLFSSFSHRETWHLACNMVVLWSFSPVIHDMLGREQFLAFYVSGGLFSAYVSHLFKVLSRNPTPSLGASGCILAVLGAVCVANPDARLSVLFLPFFSFSASKALVGLLCFDLAGLVFRLKLFDHAAHLGGLAFGCWYISFGHNYIWDQRHYIVRKWHEWRRRFSK